MNQLVPAPPPYLLDPNRDLTSPWSNFRLSTGAEDFTVSAPIPGDATLSARAAPDSQWVTLGSAAVSLQRLRNVVGQRAELRTQDGRLVCDLRIEKIDPRFNVVVAKLQSRAS